MTKEEKNQTLKDKIEFLTNCLDDRDKSIAIMQEENRKLREFKAKQEEMMFLIGASIELAEPKTYRDAEKLQKGKEIYEKLYKKELYSLREENKRLNEKIKNMEKAEERFFELMKNYVMNKKEYKDLED